MRRVRLFFRRAWGGLPTLTWLICATAFVNRAGAMVVPFLSLYLGQKFGYSVEQAGYVVALFGVGSVCGSLLGGRLADRFGPVPMQIATLLATGGWMALLALAETPLAFSSGVFVLGILNDAFRPGNVAAVAATVPPFRQTKALALNRFALNAGWAIGPTIGGALAGLDYRLLFLADGATCMLAAGLLWRYAPRDLGRATRRHEGDAAARAPSPWRDGRFLFLLVLSTIGFVVFLQHVQTLSRHLERVLHYDEFEIGLVLAINPLFIVVCEMPLVWRFRNTPKPRLMVAGAACIGAAFPWLVLESWGTVAVVLSALTVSVGEMLYMPFLGAYVSEYAPVHARGNYLGAYFATFSVSLVLAPPLGGAVYERFGADALWLGCGAAGALAAVGFRWLGRTAGAGAARGARG
ncbi:MAG TPA: MFS transporter [Planctomycetota bacterium]|nr:MFS transporter [Planctomycetota bacterium]